MGGVEQRLAVAFYVATLIAVFRVSGSSPRGGCAASASRSGELACLLALVAGGLTHPALVGAIVTLGVGAGLGLEVGDGVAHVATWRGMLAVVCFAPLFEEALYRGHLLPLCAARFGAPSGIALSSIAFALPHARPWPVLGALVTGAILGALRLRVGRLAPCVALHSGWNAAACLWPPSPWPGWGHAAPLGALGLCALLWAARMHPARRPPPTARDLDA